MQERVEIIHDTAPGQIITGKSGSTQHIGYKYKENLVALENFFYGNALYVFHDKWEELSRKSRATLLSDSTVDVTFEDDFYFLSHYSVLPFKFLATHPILKLLNIFRMSKLMNAGISLPLSKSRTLTPASINYRMI